VAVITDLYRPPIGDATNPPSMMGGGAQCVGLTRNGGVSDVIAIVVRYRRRA
jgi:hypothetical protein